MGAAKNVLVAIGVTCIVLSVIPMIFSIIATVTYVDGVGVVEDKENLRDALKDTGADTSYLDAEIEEDKDTLNTKKIGMAVCYPVTFVLLLVGIFLIIIGVKKGKK